MSQFISLTQRSTFPNISVSLISKCHSNFQVKYVHVGIIWSKLGECGSGGEGFCWLHCLQIKQITDLQNREDNTERQILLNFDQKNGLAADPEFELPACSWL